MDRGPTPFPSQSGHYNKTGKQINILDLDNISIIGKKISIWSSLSGVMDCWEVPWAPNPIPGPMDLDTIPHGPIALLRKHHLKFE